MLLWEWARQSELEVEYREAGTVNNWAFDSAVGFGMPPTQAQPTGKHLPKPISLRGFP